jgi:hypothetical protein
VVYTVRRIQALGLTCVILGATLLVQQGTASAKPPQCPASNELADLPEVEAFVLEAGGEIGQELTDFFHFIDENEDGLICFKTLPEATPFPTPPLLATDNRLPKLA